MTVTQGETRRLLAPAACWGPLTPLVSTVTARRAVLHVCNLSRGGAGAGETVAPSPGPASQIRGTLDGPTVRKAELRGHGRLGARWRVPRWHRILSGSDPGRSLGTHLSPAGTSRDRCGTRITRHSVVLRLLFASQRRRVSSLRSAPTRSFNRCRRWASARLVRISFARKCNWIDSLCSNKRGAGSHANEVEMPLLLSRQLESIRAVAKRPFEFEVRDLASGGLPV